MPESTDTPAPVNKVTFPGARKVASFSIASAGEIAGVVLLARRD